MSDHNFEQQVQQSLEQLKLRPSVAVWAEVEKNIRKDKRRRRMIMWLPICLLFLGAGGFFMLRGDHATDKSSVAANTTAPSTTDHTTIAPNTSTTDNNSTQSKDNTTTTPVEATPAAVEPQHEAEATPAEVSKTNRQNNKVVIAQKQRATTAIIPHHTVVKQQKKQVQLKQHKNNRPEEAQQSFPPDQLVLVEVKDSTTTASVTIVADSMTAISTVDSTTMVTTTITPDSAATASTTLVDSAVKAIELVKQPETPAKATVTQKDLALQRPKRGRWQWGVQAEAGFSGVTRNGLLSGLFNFLNSSPEVNKVADIAAAPLQNYQGSISNGAVTYAPQFPRPVNGPSEITMGPSLSVGAFVQRTFSRRFSLSAGLQYAYLSTRTVVGSKVNNSRAVNQANYSARLVSSYYDANNTEDYTNRYHFIELPITLHTKLNRSSRLPITWDLGGSVTRMIGTTALHYDGYGGVYYKDNSLFNKTQWVASTGFNIGLFQQSKHPLAIGPSLRYNMTNMLQKEYNINQHLWSVGLKATVLLKK